MRQNIKARIEELKFYDEKPIGIFGARASGKTIFFTVLYGLSGFNTAEEKFSVICDEPESRKYLKKNYSYLLDGKLPPRTEINDITKINMNYFYNNSSYTLRSFDFAGELLKDHYENEHDKHDKAFMELQDQIYAFFANCSGILVFIEPNSDKKEGFERQTEIDKLLGFLKDYKGRWGFDIPMGLVITKWDKVSQDLNKKTYEEEEYKVESYVAQHDIYRNVYSLLSGVSSDVKIFPVSAFGQAKEKDLPPDDLKPFNLFTPLVWIAKTRDKEWKDKIIQELKENITEKDAKDIVDVFRENVDNKDMVKEVNTAYKKFLRKRKSKRTLSIAAIIIVVLGVGYYLGSPYINKRLDVNRVIKVSKTTDNTQKMEELKNYYEKYKKKDEAVKKYFEENEEIFKQEIEKNIEYPDKKLKYIETFMEIYPDSIYKQEMEALKAFTIYEKNMENANNNFDRYQLSKKYIREYPYYKNLEVVRGNFNKHLKLADREKYQEITSKNIVSKNNEELFKEIEFYLSIEDFTDYRKEVNEIKQSIEEESHYQRIIDSLSNYNRALTKESLKDLELKASNYISNTIIGKYEARIKDILKQLKNVENGVEMDTEYHLRAVKPINAKKIVLKVNVNNKDNYIEKQNVNEKEIYVGSAYLKINVITEFDLTLFLTEKNGTEKQFTASRLKINDLNNYIAMESKENSETIEIRIRINENNLKIK